MAKLTANELAVLTAIDESEYGETLRDAVWTFTVNQHSALQGKSISGTVSSLTRKGFVRSGGRGDEASIEMTETGEEAYIAAKKGSTKKPGLKAFSAKYFPK